VPGSGSPARPSRAGDPLPGTGIGLVTPAGVGTRETWAGVLANRPTAAHDPALAGLPVTLSCRVPGYDPRVHLSCRQPWRYDRYTQFALTAAREAVADAALDPEHWDGARVAVVLGSAAGGVGTYEQAVRTLHGAGPSAVSPLTLPAFLPNMAAGQVAIDLRARGPALHTATACASGATAIMTAALLLEAGACDVALAGGADAMITPMCVAGFAQTGALSRNPDPATASRPFDADRDGFVIAEGAGFLLLERRDDATARRAPVRALLAGYASATDAHHAVAPHPEARGLAEAVRQSLRMAGALPEDVDHVNAHGTSTPLNDRYEAAMLARLLPAGRASVTSAKGVLGHGMGAAGAVEAALTVLTVQHRLVPATGGHRNPDPCTSDLDVVLAAPRRQDVRLALSNSSGFGGHNTVLAFTPATTGPSG
jgi:3-oxoacyl-[acyl-carrier-protein] synthase II